MMKADPSADASGMTPVRSELPPQCESEDARKRNEAERDTARFASRRVRQMNLVSQPVADATATETSWPHFLPKYPHSQVPSATEGRIWCLDDCQKRYGGRTDRPRDIQKEEILRPSRQSALLEQSYPGSKQQDM